MWLCTPELSVGLCSEACKATWCLARRLTDKATWWCQRATFLMSEERLEVRDHDDHPSFQLLLEITFM
jgi:hypothetical protein